MEQEKKEEEYLGVGEGGYIEYLGGDVFVGAGFGEDLVEDDVVEVGALAV